MTDAGRVENPLISNEKLKQIYKTMVQARLLEQLLMQLQRKRKSSVRFRSILGQEACKVSTLIELTAGDLISDSVIHPVTDLVLGVAVKPLLREARSDRNTHLRSRNTIRRDHRAQQIPAVPDATERIGLALGAALSLKLLKRNNIVLAYLYQHELGESTWKKVLSTARELELPIIFVVLPSPNKTASTPIVCGKARSAGVPGIPVDLADAVALFRVIQESLGRTRGGDGPVVIECLTASRNRASNDPLIRMKQFLLERRVCSEHWIDAIARSFAKKLDISSNALGLH